ncbi:MAG: DUF1844 domain-containing protein [Myxococcota bacterium]|nr:DUF1844 domain-containing protein [Myxococcota bacterium]
MTDSSSEPQGASSGDEGAKESSTDPGALPGIDFSTFLLSLSTSALYHMGVVLHPESGEAAELNPMLARQTIDTLEMLHEKTRGNLDDEEKKLFDGLLYELRMRFVELTNE